MIGNPDELLKDLSSKYNLGYDDAKISQIKQTYGEDYSSLLSDLSGKYNLGYDQDKITTILNTYDLGKKKEDQITLEEPQDGFGVISIEQDTSNPGAVTDPNLQNFEDVIQAKDSISQAAVEKSEEESSILSDINTTFAKGVASIGKAITEVPKLISDLSKVPSQDLHRYRLNKKVAKGEISQEQADKMLQALGQINIPGTLGGDLGILADNLKNSGVNQYFADAQKQFSDDVKRSEEGVVNLLKEGKVGAASRELGLSIVETVPHLMVMAATGGAGLPTVGTIAAAEKNTRLQDEGYDASSSSINGLISGVAEGFFEKYTQGILKGAGDDIVKGVKEGFDRSLKEMAQKAGYDFNQEGISEVFTTMSQNAADIITGTVEAKSAEEMYAHLVNGVPDSYVIGGFMGGGISAAAQVPGAIKSKKNETSEPEGNEASQQDARRGPETGDNRTEKITENEGKTEPEVTKTEAKLTQEAEDILSNKDGVPAFISNNLKKVAKDNGVEITPDMTPNDVINALRKKKEELNQEIGNTGIATSPLPGGSEGEVAPNFKPKGDNIEGSKLVKTNKVNGRLAKNEEGVIEVTNNSGKRASKKKRDEAYIQLLNDNKSQIGTLEPTEKIPTEVPSSEISKYIAEKSTNPKEIAEAYLSEPDIIDATGGATTITPQDAIHATLGRGAIAETALEEIYSDQQIKEFKKLKPFSVTGKKKGSINEIVEELNEANPGMNITDSDVKDYLDKYKFGNDSYVPSNKEAYRNPIKDDLSDRFLEVTDGIPLNESTAEAAIEIFSNLEGEVMFSQQVEGKKKGYSKFINRVLKDKRVDRDVQKDAKEKLTKEEAGKRYAVPVANDMVSDMVRETNGDLKMAYENLVYALDTDKARANFTKSPVLAGATRLVLSEALMFASSNSDLPGMREMASKAVGIIEDLGSSGGAFNVYGRSDMNPAAILNNAVLGIVNLQAERANELGASGRTYKEIAEDLARMIEKFKSAQKTSAKKPTKKAEIRRKREDLKEKLKQIKERSSSVGFAFNPKEEGKFRAEEVKILTQIAKTYIDEGIDKLKDVLEKLKKVAQDLGYSDIEATQISEEAISQVEDIVASENDAIEFIANIVKKETGKKPSKAKVKELINKDNVTAEDIFNKLGVYMNIPSIDPDKLIEFKRKSDVALSMPPGRLRQKKMNEAIDYAQIHFAQSTDGFAIALWHASVLSNPKTWAAVIFGNIQNTYDTIALALASGKAGARGLSEGLKGIKYSLAEAARILSTGQSFKQMDKIIESSILETTSSRSKGRGFKEDLKTNVAKGARYTSRVMNALDVIGYQFSHDTILGIEAYRIAKAEAESSGKKDFNIKARINELVKNDKAERAKSISAAKTQLEGIAESKGLKFKDLFSEQDVIDLALSNRNITLDNIDPSVTSAADFQGKKVALQNKATGMFGILADLPNAINNMITAGTPPKETSRRAKTLKFFNKIVFPYLNTAANMTNLMMDNVPILGIGVAWIDSSLGENYRRVSGDTAIQRRAFAIKQVIGSSIMMGLLSAALDEEDDWFSITAEGPKNYKDRQALYSTGWKPFTMKFGGTRFSFRDNPLAGPLMILGAYADSIKYKKDDQDAESMNAMTGVLMGYFANAGMLKTFGNLSKAVERRDSTFLLEVLAAPLTGYTNPGIIKYIQGLVAPGIEDRKTYKDTPMGQLFGTLMSNVAIAGKLTLDSRYDALGQKIKPGVTNSLLGKGTGFDRYFSNAKPLNWKWATMAKHNVYLSGISEQTEPFGIKMTHREYNKYALAVGLFRDKALEESKVSIKSMDKESFEIFLKSLDKQAKLDANYFFLDNYKTRGFKRDDWIVKKIARI